MNSHTRHLCASGPRPAGFGLLLLATLLSGCGGLPVAPKPNDPQAVALLTAQSDAWDRAIVRKDRAAIEANMTGDFRQIDGGGNVYDKRSFIEELISPDLTIDPYTVEDFTVRLYGDVALLSGQSRLTGHFKGKKFQSHYRYIDVYVKRGGEWKVASVQISKIAN